MSIWIAQPAFAKELRRSMPFIRPLLMGEAYVAVADEASVLFFNPAGLDGLKETSVEAFTPQLAFNEPVRLALVDSDKFSAELDEIQDDLDNDNFETLLGRSFFTDLSIRTPFVIFPEKGLALGLGVEALANLQILPNRTIPLIRVEFFRDAQIFITRFGGIGDSFSYGVTAKGINRVGVDRTYTPGDLLGGADSLTNRQEWLDVQNNRSFTKGGLDLGFIYRLQGRGGWEPRIGLSMLNIGGFDSEGRLVGMEFGPRLTEFDPPQAGELPQINTVGFAVSPFWRGIRFTMAADVVDFTRTALPGSEIDRRLRLGFAMGLFPHADGAARLSLLAGSNGGHPSFGILSRIWIFEVGFGSYTVEMGDENGDFPDERTVFTFGFRF
ncbi:MAG: hypothetical protein IID61_04865 [SAR324 cluster bacterium]|nr:hypothetical protein [SAR324 cluster bacterium]